jgi:phosphoribosylformylglycinamidine synthase
LDQYACLGGNPRQARLSLQEYFDNPGAPAEWGQPAKALLGALEAQLVLGVPAIGGKDSMSGGYSNGEKRISVPPTLVAFAAGLTPVEKVRSGALSGRAGNTLVLLFQDPFQNEWEVFKKNMDALGAFGGSAVAAFPLGAGGIGASVAIAAFGNSTGVALDADALDYDYQWYQGSVLAEIKGNAEDISAILKKAGAYRVIGKTLDEPVFRIFDKDEKNHADAPLALLRRAYEYPLADVYPQIADGVTVLDRERSGGSGSPPSFLKAGWSEGEPRQKPRQMSANLSRIPRFGAPPLALLPVFPGTNCEWDMEKKFRAAGASIRQLVFLNRTREDAAASIAALADALDQAQIIALSGGFSAGDEPDGSGKFIANVFRAPRVMDAVNRFLERGGLILGICNGFQALVKLGLLPYGEFRAPQAGSPSLTFNRVGRHISRMVRTRVMLEGKKGENDRPWLRFEESGGTYVEPVSHGEGRFVISEGEGKRLFERGQAAFCYADADGNIADAEPDNPNGSSFALEGITSPDGRILGKMAHTERAGAFIHINIPRLKSPRIFEAGVRYFE